MLKSAAFKNRNLLCAWVNDNALEITIHGICNDEFSDIVMFYTEDQPEIEQPTAQKDIVVNIKPMTQEELINLKRVLSKGTTKPTQ